MHVRRIPSAGPESGNSRGRSRIANESPPCRSAPVQKGNRSVYGPRSTEPSREVEGAAGPTHGWVLNSGGYPAGFRELAGPRAWSSWLPAGANAALYAYMHPRWNILGVLLGTSAIQLVIAPVKADMRRHFP